MQNEREILTVTIMPFDVAKATVQDIRNRVNTKIDSYGEEFATKVRSALDKIERLKVTPVPTLMLGFTFSGEKELHNTIVELCEMTKGEFFLPLHLLGDFYLSMGTAYEPCLAVSPPLGGFETEEKLIDYIIGCYAYANNNLALAASNVITLAQEESKLLYYNQQIHSTIFSALYRFISMKIYKDLVAKNILKGGIPDIKTIFGGLQKSPGIADDPEIQRVVEESIKKISQIIRTPFLSNEEVCALFQNYGLILLLGRNFKMANLVFNFIQGVDPDFLPTKQAIEIIQENGIFSVVSFESIQGGWIAKTH